MSDTTPEIWRYPRWQVVLIAVVVVVVAVAVLLLLRPDPGSAVQWENYPAGLQDQIEQAAAAGDCDTLTALREDAVATEVQQIEETGIGNETLIKYLVEELDSAGCRG